MAMLQDGLGSGGALAASRSWEACPKPCILCIQGQPCIGPERISAIIARMVWAISFGSARVARATARPPTAVAIAAPPAATAGSSSRVRGLPQAVPSSGPVARPYHGVRGILGPQQGVHDLYATA